MEDTYKTPATEESVWAAFRETDRLIKEARAEAKAADVRHERRMAEAEQKRLASNADYERRMAEYRAEAEKRNAEAEQKRLASNADFEQRVEEADRLRKASEEKFDSELAKSRADHEQRMKEWRTDHQQRMKEWDEKYEKSRAENERLRKEADARYERRMKNIEDRYGSHSFNIGEFAEEYFFNSFEEGNQNFFGERFDDYERNVKGPKRKVKDEYDIVLYNCNSIAIIETKFKAHENDLPKVIKKPETFRINYPEFANHRIYLGLASMSFYPELENKCIEEGIAIIKQLGNTVIINDKHLKAF